MSNPFNCTVFVPVETVAELRGLLWTTEFNIKGRYPSWTAVKVPGGYRITWEAANETSLR